MEQVQRCAQFDRLPVELLEIIILYVEDREALMSLSCANKLFRQLCVPVLFRTLRTGFSIAGLTRLLEVSRSDLASHVREIIYEAANLVDPRKPRLSHCL